VEDHLMRVYQKKFFRQMMREQKRNAVESRDAVVYSIDENNFYAEVKIQGSNSLLRAHYPRNIYSRPKWLKVGNSCRVVHKGGEGGFVEITGPGRALPTPIAGGDVPTPPAVVQNTIISGLGVTATNPGSDKLYVAAGYYRIDGVTYTHNPDGTGDTTDILTMAADSEMTMGAIVNNDALTMGVPFGISGYTPVTLTTAPPNDGYFRYDSFFIGTDGVIDVVSGSNFTTTATYASTPADHLRIVDILIVGDTGASAPTVDQYDVNRSFTTRQSSYFEAGTPMDEDTMAWSLTTDYPTKTVTIYFRDQYGWAYSKERSIQVTMEAGTGTFGWSGGTMGTDAIQKTATMSQLSFVYTRNQLASPEFNPLFLIKEINGDRIQTVHGFTLLDMGGDPV
jgi:hypothetical protein